MSRNRGGNKIQIKNLVGVLTVVLVAAYFIFMLVSFKNQKKISFYEVEEGSIARETSYEGLILRHESVMYADASGYVNFYIADGKKAPMNSRVYSIDENGDLKKFINDHSEDIRDLSAEKLKALHSDLIVDSRNFNPVNFSNSYVFKEKLEADVAGLSDNDLLSRIADDVRAAGIRYIDCRTDMTGTVSYCIDGFEEKKRNDILLKDFDRSGYKSTRLKANDLVDTGMPVYKLITDENWEILFPVSDQDMEELSGKDSLKIRFKNHGIETTAAFEIFKNTEGVSIGALKLNRYLVRFLNNRYVNFEIETNQVSGLKIPEKSISSKEFYKIPASLKMKDERGNSGVWKLTPSVDGNSYSFLVVETYLEDGESCFIDLKENGDLKPGDYIGNPEDTSISYQIQEVRSLPGAYNINKGYAIFKQIEELERANGYCIIKKNTPYGLSVYDHIILDASTVEEGEVLY